MHPDRQLGRSEQSDVADPDPLQRCGVWGYGGGCDGPGERELGGGQRSGQILLRVGVAGYVDVAYVVVGSRRRLLGYPPWAGGWGDGADGDFARVAHVDQHEVWNRFDAVGESCSRETRQHLNVLGVRLLTDSRGNDRIMSEPYIMLGLEPGYRTPELQRQARQVLAAQEARYQRTRLVTAPSEDAVAWKH